jgi:hypothetical protein
MGVIIDAVPPLQFLNVPEIGFRVRARYAITDRLEGVKECLLHAAAHSHPPARGQVLQDSGKPALQSDHARNKLRASQMKAAA